jgi:mannose-6-phosphate isomerase-like protein (cupin superfamily)
LFGTSPWHSHPDTDEVFVVLAGELTVLYKLREEERVVVKAGEVLCLPMGMEHCLVAEEGTEVLLLEGSQEGE